MPTSPDLDRQTQTSSAPADLGPDGAAAARHGPDPVSGTASLAAAGPETASPAAGPAGVRLSERIMMPPPAPRLTRVTDWMAAHDVDVLVVTGASLVTWLTGYARYYGGLVAAVIGADGSRTLAVCRDEVAVAQELSAASAVVGYGEHGFGLELHPVPLLAAELLAVPALSAAVASGARIGVAGELSADVVSAVDAAGPSGLARTVSADGGLHEISLVKDLDELARIHHSYELCWLAHAAVAAGTAAGASEIEMFSAAHAAAQVGHGSPVEFGADLLAGPATARVCAPLAIAGPGRPGPGEPVVADLSVGADGYWADTCRTHIRGDSEQVREIEAQLKDIQRAAAARLCSGTAGSAVFEVLSSRIAQAWPDGEFPHHGGHSVGLSVFDDPHIIPADDRPVESWMVMALEPGIYLPGKIGVRHENLYLVTPDGGIDLAQAIATPFSGAAQAAWKHR